MTVSKAILDARARLASARGALASADAKQAASEAAIKPLRTRLARFRKRHGAPALMLAANQHREITLGELTMPTWHLDRSIGALKGAKRRKAVAEAVEAGAIDITLPSGSVNYKLRGLAQRFRVLAPGGAARLAAANRRVARAYKALDEAQKALVATKLDLYEEGFKVPVEQLAEAITEHVLLDMDVREASPRDELSVRYERERLERGIADAQGHLDHATSRSKDPCPCSACSIERQNARWKAENEARAKARAKEQAAEARKLARAPKREFTCPNCNDTAVSPVVTEHTGVKFVECESCESSFRLDVIKSTPAGKAPGQTAAFAN